MAWTHYSNCIRNGYGPVIANVRIIVDYNAAGDDRIAALLEIKDYSEGSGNTITIDPSDAAATVWTEGSDFNAATSNAVTAENIATAINGTANYTASATATGQDGNPFVSVVYTAGGHIDSASSNDTNAWEFYTVNSTSGAIAKIASDDSGTIRHQPIFANSSGLFDFYINAPVDIDLTPYKSGYNFNTSYCTDITIAT